MEEVVEVMEDILEGDMEEVVEEVDILVVGTEAVEEVVVDRELEEVEVGMAAVAEAPDNSVVAGADTQLPGKVVAKFLYSVVADKAEAG